MRAIFIITLSFLFIALFSLSGCIGKKYIHGNIIHSENQKSKYIEILKKQYPQEFKLQHRIVLNILGKQYDFIGYLMINRNKTYRALAFNEMAGKFFDFESNENENKILFKPQTMPPNPITDGVMEDLKHLYYFCENSMINQDKTHSAKLNKIVIEENPGEEKSIIFYTAKNDFNAYIFDSSATKITKSLQTKNGKIIREVEYSEYKPVNNIEYKGINNFPIELPHKIILKNNKWHYTMEIYLLKAEEKKQ